MIRLSRVLVSLCLASLAGCQDTRRSAAPADRPRPEPAGPVAEKGSLAAARQPGPGRDKEMLGLELRPFDGWKPVWDARDRVARWEHKAYMSPIVVRLVTEKLDDIADLKRAAPWMMQLGTAITRVIEVRHSGQGWYAVVRRGKEKNLVYVHKFGDAYVVCSARLTRSQIRTIKKKTALRACESIRLRSRSGPWRSGDPKDPGAR